MRHICAEGALNGVLQSQHACKPPGATVRSVGRRGCGIGAQCATRSHRSWLLNTISLSSRLEYDMALCPCEGRAVQALTTASDIIAAVEAAVALM